MILPYCVIEYNTFLQEAKKYYFCQLVDREHHRGKGINPDIN